jgi:predicted transcriptional regulator
MSQAHVAPTVRPGGLVTVAFLKARLDEGSDHLGMFMPLVLDVLSRLSPASFTTEEIQETLAKDHGVAIPQQTVATLLRRAVAKGYLLRDMGRYKLGTTLALPSGNVTSEKAVIEAGQLRMADALCQHAKRRGFSIDSAENALDMIFKFLEAEQVTMLLGGSSGPNHSHADGRLERTVVAEFIQDLVSSDPALLAVLKRMLEGLVLYNAAFLPDLAQASRRFKNLRVVFDSNLVRQVLGYEGNAMRALMRETLDILKGSEVQCLVFDKTVHEIKRILSMYEARLGTSEGRRSLRPVPMARHFLTKRYAPSDIREMAALLEREINAAGFQIIRVPDRVRQLTAGERTLTMRLANPVTKDELEPRVVHDVDCVAGILTLRKGHRSTGLEDAQFIFATGSSLVVRNTRLWWEEDEHETGIEPVVHIRALSNLAWLKKPSLCLDFKLRELVALCTAALRPAQGTWDRFLRHLDALQKSQKIKSDEVTAILVSAMSDRLLREAESIEDDPEDIDAVTLDEVVDRVKASYVADAEKRLQAVTTAYDGRLSEIQGEVQAVRSEYEKREAELQARTREAVECAKTAEHSASERARRLSMAIEGRAHRWARCVTLSIKWMVVVFLSAGAIALITGHPFHRGWIGIVIGIAVVLFVGLELVGIFRHVSEWQALGEARLTRSIRDWLTGERKDIVEME